MADPNPPARLVMQIAGPPNQVDQVVRLLAGDGFIPWGDLEAALAESAQFHRHNDLWNLTRRPADGRKKPICSPEARQAVMELLHDQLRKQLEWTAMTARRRPQRQPLDFRGIVPIPGSVLWAGYRNGGLRWCMKHWGCLPLLEAASLEIGTELIDTRPDLRGRGTRKRAPKGSIIRRRRATYGFECRGGWPWPIVKAIQAAWPETVVTLREDWIDSGEDEMGREEREGPPSVATSPRRTRGTPAARSAVRTTRSVLRRVATG